MTIISTRHVDTFPFCNLYQRSTASENPAAKYTQGTDRQKPGWVTFLGAAWEMGLLAIPKMRSVPARVAWVLGLTAALACGPNKEAPKNAAEYLKQLHTAECENHALCSDVRGPLYPSLEVCERKTEVIAGNFRLRNGEDPDAKIIAGNTAFNGEEALACLEWLAEKRSCSEPSPLTNAHCVAALTVPWIRPLGAACHAGGPAPVFCQPGLSCAGDGDACGTCQPKAKAGESCSDVDCGGDLICILVGGTGSGGPRCEAAPREGQPCAAFCAGKLSCPVFSDNATCKRLGGPGAACDVFYNYECMLGLTCTDKGTGRDGTCQPERADGTECHLPGDDECFSLYCVPDGSSALGGRCRLPESFPTAGNPCAFDSAGTAHCAPDALVTSTQPSNTCACEAKLAVGTECMGLEPSKCLTGVCAAASNGQWLCGEPIENGAVCQQAAQCESRWCSNSVCGAAPSCSQ